MPKFKVDVSDPAVTRGLTPYVVEAKLKAVLEKRRVTEPGEWLPLEAMTHD